MELDFSRYRNDAKEKKDNKKHYYETHINPSLAEHDLANSVLANSVDPDQLASEEAN